MRQISILLATLCLSTLGHSDLKVISVNEQIKPNNAPLQVEPVRIDPTELSGSFEQGRNIRKSWEERKARRKHKQAMQELRNLNLDDNDAVMDFIKKYPDEVDTLKEVLIIQRSINN